MKKTRIISTLSAAALVSMVVVGIPSVAHAAGPQCDGKVPINSCQGATSDSAPYVMQVPANFNGTLVCTRMGTVPMFQCLPVFPATVVIKSPIHHNRVHSSEARTHQ
jgi:hypothetical protein